MNREEKDKRKQTMMKERKKEENERIKSIKKRNRKIKEQKLMSFFFL